MTLKRCAALLLVLLLIPALPAEAENELYTASCFAGDDPSALEYIQILRRFEEKTGIRVRDDSEESSEAWKKKILNDFAAGNEPDVLFFFAAGADSAPILPRVVPLAEINREIPDAPLREEDALREPDGQVYAVPVRPFWEGLFINTELFERYHVALPTTWELFLKAVRAFREAGIVPLAVSLTDSPHYVAEMALLACATAEEQQARPRTAEEVPASWLEAMTLIRELYEAGAFPDNVNATDAATTTALFLEGKAAMQVDGSWFAEGLTDTDRFEVLPIPLRDPGRTDRPYLGGVSMGFYLTRRAWERPSTHDAALQLLQYLTNPENAARLSGSGLTGALKESAERMTSPEHRMLRPVQDDMSAAARETWLLDCIPAVAEGSMTPEECWRKVMALRPFE